MRDQHVERILQFLMMEFGFQLLPDAQAVFVLTLHAMLLAAIEDGVREEGSRYESLMEVTVN